MNIEKITVEPHSILVVHAESGSHAQSIASDATAIARATGAAAVVALRPGESIESLDDAALRRAGLMRITVNLEKVTEQEAPAE